MEETEKSLAALIVTLKSSSGVSIKDTTLTKFNFKVNSSSDAKELAKVLENKFGVEDAFSMVTSRCQYKPIKLPLEDYQIYLDVTFGTELETVATFSAQLRSVSFRHTVKDVGDGVEDTVDATMELLKNEDGVEDSKVRHYLNFKETNPQTGKKLLVPMKFEFWKRDNNPIVYTEISEVEPEEA